MDQSSTSLDERMRALLDEARQGGYASGWADAIRTIVTAVTDAAPKSPGMPARERRASGVTQESSNGQQLRPTVSGKRAPWGLSNRAVAAALNRAGDTGIDLEFVRTVGMELEGFTLAESSIRSTFSDFAERGEIVRRGDRWFKVNKETAGSAIEATPAAPATHHQGGSDARTTLATH